jgi:uncharacterized protein (DUF3084 family)
MIFTDKAAREKIASLESRISELEADALTKDSAIEAHAAEISAKDQTIAEHVASIASRDEQIAELTGKVSTAESTLSEKEAKITELESKNVVTAETVSLQAAELLASTGHPASVDLASETGTDKTEKSITREQFNALDHFERGKFIAQGGKLKD